MNMMLFLVTSLSLILAAIMTGVTWRLTRQERQRSSARVATLASDLGFDQRTYPEAGGDGVELFRSEEAVPAVSRLRAVATIGAFAVAAALALIVVTSRAGQSVSEPVALPDDSATRSAAETAPLELTALTHERDGDDIIVSGVVRNPPAGTDQERIAVVVFVFTRDGAFLASGRSTLPGPALAPGVETSFAVTVPHATEVGRYRVSFRTDDRVVAHVDRRGRSSIARSQ
ncbi:MAG: hypothetical protein ABI868_05925 [Acidobacteriota bacterium]